MRYLFVVGVSSFLCGCLPLSVHPLHTGEDDIVFDEMLLGTWQEDNDAQESWQFDPIPDDPQRYLLTVDNGDGRIGRFVATLASVGDRWFLDLLPLAAEPGMDVNEWYAMHLLALRSFLRFERVENALTLATPNIDKLRKLLRDHPEYVEHELVIGDGGESTRVLFTANSSALASFVRQHLDDETYFADKMVMSRVVTTGGSRPIPDRGIPR